MDILEKARELGISIAESEEMLRLKRAEAGLDTDDKARLLMKEYKELQIAVIKASKEKKEAGVLDEVREKLIEKQRELNEYNVTYEYLDAKSAFDSFMKNINDVISFAITGEVQCSSDKCGSCGGCR